MSVYSLVKFAHVVSMLWLFAGIAFEWFVLSQLTGSGEPPASRAWPRSSKMLPFFTVFPVPLILFTGVYLAIKIEGFGWPWVKLSFLVLFLLAISGAVSWRQLVRLRQTTEKTSFAGEKPGAMDARPSLMTNRFRLCIALGVVFLMVARTDAMASAAVIVASLIAPLLWSFSIWKRSSQSV